MTENARLAEAIKQIPDDLLLMSKIYQTCIYLLRLYHGIGVSDESLQKIIDKVFPDAEPHMAEWVIFALHAAPELEECDRLLWAKKPFSPLEQLAAQAP